MAVGISRMFGDEASCVQVAENLGYEDNEDDQDNVSAASAVLPYLLLFVLWAELCDCHRSYLALSIHLPINDLSCLIKQQCCAFHSNILFFNDDADAYTCGLNPAG